MNITQKILSQLNLDLNTSNSKSHVSISKCSHLIKDGGNIDFFYEAGSQKKLYPASVFKVFILAGILDSVDKGDLELTKEIIFDLESLKINKSVLFPPFKQSSTADLVIGQSYKVGYLIDLMMQESNNNSANILFDVLGRRALEENILNKYGFLNTYVTKHFSKRFGQPDFRFYKSIVSTPNDICRFYYLVQKGEMINEMVSKNIKKLLKRYEVGADFSYIGKDGSMLLDFNSSKSEWFGKMKALFKKTFYISKYKHYSGICEIESEDYCFCVFTTN
jgi:hypothetical protein